MALTNDELNEYLECTCGHCDEGRSKCCTREDKYLPVIAPYEEIDERERVNQIGISLT